MKIIRAEHLGMCFGVRDAIALATKQSKAAPITILGDLVHNETVLGELRRDGVQIEKDLQNIVTETVMISAHGASVRRINEARQLGLNVLSAACPLVEVAHQAVKELVRGGFHPVIVGKRDHVEVRGLTEDLDEFDVVLNEGDVDQLAVQPRFGIVAQTTQPIEKVLYLVSLIGQKFPASDVRFRDTVCRPTKERQTAAVELAQHCDVVIVIGGAQSNNTRELVHTCRRYCPRVYHVQDAADLRPEWFDVNDRVGITAGTSTPDHTIDAVERAIPELRIPVTPTRFAPTRRPAESRAL